MPERSGFSGGRRRLAELRLVAQELAASRSSTPGEAVRCMLALQAQDFPGVKWSVGLRHEEASEAGVEAAFDAGEIVRSWPLRGTLHLVAADDLGWLLELTTPRMLASAAGRRAALGITNADVEQARETAVGALSGQRFLTRGALLAAFEAGGVSTDGQRGYHLLGYLAQTGTLVLGSTEGRQQAFALLDRWVASPRRLARDEALGELALRYFRSHGPATEYDLARWSGLALGDVRRGLAICGSRLTTIQADGVRYHLGPESLDAPRPTGCVRLLPGFDEYLLGYRDRSPALAPEHFDAIAPGANGMFRPTIVAGGQVVGTWRRRITAREVLVEATPFARLPARTSSRLEEAAEAYARFLGRPARVRIARPG